MHSRALWQAKFNAKFNAAFNLKVAENCIYSYEVHKNLLPPELFPLAHAPHRLSAGASPQTPLWELIALSQDPLAGLGFRVFPRKGEMEGREGGRWDCDPSIRDRKGGDLEGRMGWEGREGKEWEGGRGNKHTRFKTCGAAAHA